MMPGLNPKMMKQAMKQLGIKEHVIEAHEVVIRCPDKEIVIANPSVSKINMMGQDTWQIVGQAQEHPLSSQPEITEDDLSMVMAQAHVDRETAHRAIEDAHGDLAQALIDLEK